MYNKLVFACPSTLMQFQETKGQTTISCSNKHDISIIVPQTILTILLTLYFIHLGEMYYCALLVRLKTRVEHCRHAWMRRRIQLLTKKNSNNARVRPWVPNKSRERAKELVLPCLWDFHWLPTHLAINLFVLFFSLFSIRYTLATVETYSCSLFLFHNKNSFIYSGQEFLNYFGILT